MMVRIFSKVTQIRHPYIMRISADIFTVEKLKLPAWLVASIFIPIVAQIWVAPIQMFYFNTFSTYSVFANILHSPDGRDCG